MKGMIAPLCRVGRLGMFLAGVPLFSGCSGEGGKYAGAWTRDLYGEGAVHMNLASNGGLELTLPSRRWPDSLVKAQAQFTGDTLVFKADTAARACQTTDARYVVSRDQDQLHIAGVGIDGCGYRHAALVGTWQKAS
jgi:hypothetical protein